MAVLIRIKGLLGDGSEPLLTDTAEQRSCSAEVAPNRQGRAVSRLERRTWMSCTKAGHDETFG
jgi:hypothetical protein